MTATIAPIVADSSVDTEVDNNELDLFDELATDEKGEEVGVRTQIEGLGGTYWTIARHGNPRYNKLFRKLYAKNKAKLNAKGAAAEKVGQATAVAMEIELLAETVLLGWEGSIRFQKQELTYTKENARKLLELKAFRQKILETAQNAETFKLVKDAETGND